MTTTTLIAIDRRVVELTSREITPEGYLKAPARLARIGTQVYYASELGLDAALGMAPTKQVRLYRSPEAVFDPQAMATFEGATITNDHPKGMVVSAKNWKGVSVGDVHDVRRDGDYLVGTVVVRDAKAVQDVQKGKATLSGGYRFKLDLTPGQTAGGEAFDGQQLQIEGNHVAIVDVGRAGAVCRVADTQQGGRTMIETKKSAPLRGRDLFRERQRTGRHDNAEQVGAGLHGRALFMARQHHGHRAGADVLVQYDPGLNGGQR